VARSANTFVAFALFFCATAASAQSLTLSGFLTGRGVYANGRKSTLEGGWGRLDAGRERTEGFGVAQLGVDWEPAAWLNVHVQGIARADRYEDRRLGLTEAFVDLRGGDFRLRAGMFFLPTSRENREGLWSSPYTVTLSSVNTWIAQEVRPVGAELQWRRGDLLTLAGTAFRGNDSSGALLAWRGWTLGNRLAVYGDDLALPPLDPSFARQRRADDRPVTTSFGRDLDGRIGFAGRARLSWPERGSIQLAHVDNRGDRRLYGGEYAWQTRFNILSAEAGRPEATVLAAEYLDGRTGMGFAPEGFVQMNFHAAYALVSHKLGRNRFSARLDWFATTDRDHSIAEINTEHGRAWTLAWMYELTPHIRTGAEFTQVTGTRETIGVIDSHSVAVEVRYAVR